MSLNKFAAGTYALVERHGWLLAMSFLVLAPFKTLYEGPMALMALSGLALLALRPREILHLGGVRVLLSLFLLIWVPMVLSLTDAVQPERALSTTLTHLRFFFASVFILIAMQESHARKNLLLAAGVILAFWSVDGTIQAIFGRNLLGNPLVDGRVTGVYFPKIVLGHVLATMSPLLLFWLWGEANKRIWVLLLIVPLTVTVFLSGSRVAWMMFAVSLTLMIGYALFVRERMGLISRLSWVLVPVLLASGFLVMHQHFQQRFSGVAALVSGTAGLVTRSGDSEENLDKINQGTSWRLIIWKVGAKVFADHWINGIGPRGFRYIYPQYAEAGDPFVNKETNQGITHPHQLTLEIAVETGVIGLLGYLAFLGLFIMTVLAAGREQLREAWPFAAAAFISFFPLNAGHAFYGGKWGCIVWWLLALAIAYGSANRPIRS